MKWGVPTCQLGYIQAIRQKKLTKLSYSTFEFIKLPSNSASLCDLEANKDYQAGIFIAVNTKITGLPKNEKLRFSENGNKLGLFIEEFCKLTNEEKITTLKASHEMLSNFVSALKNRGKPLKKITNKKCEKNCAKIRKKEENQ